MPEPTNNILNLIDESFRPEEPSHYDLVMEIEKRRFSYCLLDNERNQFIGMGSLNQPYDKAIRSVDWLRAGFHSTRIIFSSSRATLIPATLYAEEDKENYLDFNMEREKGDIVCCDPIENLGICNIYSIPGKLHENLLQDFPGAAVCHVSTVLMESLYANFKNLMGAGKIFLNIRDEEFDMLVFSGRQLTYYNSFSYKSGEDLVYYLIFVMEQMNLNPEEMPLVLLGEADKNSELFELLFRYVRNIDLAGRSDKYGYSIVLDTIPPHRFYSLFNSIQ